METPVLNAWFPGRRAMWVVAPVLNTWFPGGRAMWVVAEIAGGKANLEELGERL